MCLKRATLEILQSFKYFIYDGFNSFWLETFHVFIKHIINRNFRFLQKL